MSRAFTAGDFEAGARALVDRWCRDPAAVNASMTVRWVEESDPVRRNAAAGGYVAAEGHLVVPERSRTLQNDESDEPPGSSDHEDVEDHHEDHEEEDDDAAAPRTVPPRGAHVRSYHVVYSKSYGCPVLLVRGVSCEPGGRVMGHAETEASLVAAATRGAEGGAEEERRRRAVSLPIGESPPGESPSNVDGEYDGERGLTAFAPWEHPHGRGGGWVGVHPCETRSAMATLLAGEGGGVGSVGSAGYMSAWISFVAAAVADLPVPAHRMNS